jgi:hypothetical protein
MTVFWDVAPCSLVEVYRCFRGACCLHHDGDCSDDESSRWRQRPLSLLGWKKIRKSYLLCFIYSLGKICILNRNTRIYITFVSFYFPRTVPLHCLDCTQSGYSNRSSYKKNLGNRVKYSAQWDLRLYFKQIFDIVSIYGNTRQNNTQYYAMWILWCS